MLRPYPFPNYINPQIARRTLQTFQWVKRYHSYQVQGLEHIPKTGPGLLVVHHSLATYDILLLGLSIFEQTGRVVRALGDRLIFKIPGLKHWASSLGVVEGHPGNARELLAKGEIVMVAPGGMREALRSSHEKYHIDWKDRTGFAALAIDARVPVIPAACPKADDLYTSYKNPLTTWFYEHLRIPLPIARGLGPTLLPRPEILTHYIGSPLLPPNWKPMALKDSTQKRCPILTRAFQSQVAHRMLHLLRME